MIINLNRIPFSKRGSYMVISELKPEFDNGKLATGLYLRTVHGSAARSIVARLTPLFDGQPDSYTTELDLTSLVIRHGEQKIEICYDDADTLLFRGSENTGIVIDFLTEQYKNDYIYDIQHRAYTLYMANCYKNNCRYLIWALRDKISLDQEWDDNVARYSRLTVSSPDGFMFALMEVETEWSGRIRKFDFGLCKRNSQEDFLEYLRNVPAYPIEYQDEVYLAAYLEWSSIVREKGFLTSDAMLISKNWLTDKTGWNLPYNALALSYKDPKRAWDQFMLIFAQMDETGRFPDSLNDSFIKWNHVKPPVHGWILSRMMEHMTLSGNQMIEAYLALKKSTQWWIRYRDFRHEGLFVYDHARDSGWNNSTVFSKFPPIATPELQAFLIIQMEVIAQLSEKLGIEDDAALFRDKAAKLLQDLLAHCFADDLPVPIHSNTHEIVQCDSLQPYLILILGERLPESIRKACIEALKSEAFHAPSGFATEKITSPHYDDERKWRGPVWGPSTYILLEGLRACGEEAFAREIAGKYVGLVKKNGLAETYNAMTGAPIGPYVYTVTASVFLTILKEFI